MNTTPPNFNVHLDPLGDTPDLKEGMERSVLTLTGPDWLGLNHGISSYLRDHDACIRSCSERRFDTDDTYGSHYIFEAPHQAMGTIKENEIKQISKIDGPVPKHIAHRYQLTVVAPDKKGILATIDETLLKRDIVILSNDTVTFWAPLSAALGGTGEDARIGTINMLIGIQGNLRDDILEDLKDGLEYLEHRYHWYIRLEQQRSRKREKDQENQGLGILDIANSRFQFNN